MRWRYGAVDMYNDFLLKRLAFLVNFCYIHWFFFETWKSNYCVIHDFMDHDIEPLTRSQMWSYEVLFSHRILYSKQSKYLAVEEVGIKSNRLPATIFATPVWNILCCPTVGLYLYYRAIPLLGCAVLNKHSITLCFP